MKHYSEVEFKKSFPNTFNYLLERKDRLGERNSDINSAWFEYGRSQALSKINKEKLIFSTIITDAIKIYKVPAAAIPYSGLYVICKSNLSLDFAKQILESKDFLAYAMNIGIHITGNSTVSSSAELHFCGDFQVDAGSTYDTNTNYTCFFRGHELGAADGDQTITINGNAVFAGVTCRSKSGVIGTKTFHGNIYSTAELRAWGTAKIVDDATTYNHTFSGCIAEGGINLQSPMRLIGGTLRKYNADPDKSGSVLGDYSLGSGKITVAGSVYVRSGGTLNVPNDVEIESGYIVLVGSYTVEGSDTTWYQAILKGDGNHTLTVNDGTNLYMRGRNNFPQNINVIFGETSKAVYDSEFDQDIYATTYGGLYLKYKTKTFLGNTTVLNQL